MQTFSDKDDSTAKAVQSNHCSRLDQLHENLKKNWFIMYDYQEKVSPDKLTSSAEWFCSADSAWKPDRSKIITEQRRKEKGESRAKQSQ